VNGQGGTAHEKAASHSSGHGGYIVQCGGSGRRLSVAADHYRLRIWSGQRDCRIIADKLSPALGQPIIVEDRPGADGALAAVYVHHQPADGYTLLMGTNSPLSADPFIHRDLGYDPIKDFVPITRVGSFTLMLVVDPNLPIHSINELVDYAKANPGKLSFASGNTAGIVGGYALAKWAEISMLHVPYKTTGPALMDIIAGRISMMFADFTSAQPHVKAGTVRPLAISRIDRSSLYPDLPTMDEAGIKASI
jgi:tripartite-type tricarboxylate transporter receptor subunit TctC